MDIEQTGRLCMYTYSTNTREPMLLETANKPHIFSSLLEIDGSYVYSNKLCSLSVSVGISSCFSSNGLI